MISEVSVKRLVRPDVVFRDSRFDGAHRGTQVQTNTRGGLHNWFFKVFWMTETRQVESVSKVKESNFSQFNRTR